MAQSSVEIAYLTAVTAQRLLLESQARQIIKSHRAMQLRPQVVESTLALQEAATITRLQTQSQGLRLVNGVLYRVGTGGNGRSIQRLPMHPLQLPQGSIGPGASSPTSGSPPATVVPQPRGLTTAPGPLQLFGVPGSAEAAPGVRIPTNVINFSDQPIGVDRRVAVPSEPVELRRQHRRAWRIGVVEGDGCAHGPADCCGVRGRSVLHRRGDGPGCLDRRGRSRLGQHRTRTRAADLRAGGWRRHGRPPASPAMRGVAAGLGIFAVVNEIRPTRPQPAAAASQHRDGPCADRLLGAVRRQSAPPGLGYRRPRGCRPRHRGRHSGVRQR